MLVKNDGSVVLFSPESDEEFEWLNQELITDSWQWMGESLVVDHRLAADILEGIEEAGFSISMQLKDRTKYVPWDEETRDCLGLALHGRTKDNEE